VDLALSDTAIVTPYIIDITDCHKTPRCQVCGVLGHPNCLLATRNEALRTASS
jgi:hypothetical protein